MIFIAPLELVGGIRFAFGWGGRLIALLFVPDMLTAYYAADRGALFSIFSDPDKFYAATPYTFLIASIIVLIFVPGQYSLDALLGRRWKSVTVKRKP